MMSDDYLFTQAGPFKKDKVYKDIITDKYFYVKVTLDRKGYISINCYMMIIKCYHNNMIIDDFVLYEDYNNKFHQGIIVEVSDIPELAYVTLLGL